MRKLLPLILCLMLAACSDSKDDSSSGSGNGDGSSSSSSSSSSSGSSSSGGGSSSGNDGSQFVGTYRGTLNAVARTNTLGTIRESYPFTARVNRNNRLRFQDEDGDLDVVTTVDDNGAFNFNFESNSSVCTGTITVRGQIRGNRISGTLSGPARCKIGNTDVRGTIEGDFAGSK